jgi:hypothetical protein
MGRWAQRRIRGGGPPPGPPCVPIVGAFWDGLTTLTLTYADVIDGDSIVAEGNFLIGNTSGATASPNGWVLVDLALTCSLVGVPTIGETFTWDSPPGFGACSDDTPPVED